MSHYELKVDLPNAGKGTVVNIPGLGDFTNGSTYEITTKQQDAFRAFHGRNVEVTDEKSRIVRNETGQAEVMWEQGPTLIQSNLPEGVTVEYVSSTPKKQTQADKDTKTPKGGDQ